MGEGCEQPSPFFFQRSTMRHVRLKSGKCFIGNMSFEVRDGRLYPEPDPNNYLINDAINGGLLIPETMPGPPADDPLSPERVAAAAAALQARSQAKAPASEPAAETSGESAEGEGAEGAEDSGEAGAAVDEEPQTDASDELRALTVADLTEMAKAMGVSPMPSRKDDIIAAILAAQQAE